ncbi:hypothetical protein MBLNU230_g4505t1 [Neophaeotheca triangularis]
MADFTSQTAQPARPSHPNRPHLPRRQSAQSTANGILSHLGKWRRAVGLGLLAATVFLWTASNFLASTIFADNTYSKPYFVTYINTAFFVVPLGPILVGKALRRPGELREELRRLFDGGIFRRKGREEGYGVLRQEEEGEEEGDVAVKDRARDVGSSQELLLGARTPNTAFPPLTASGKLSLAATARVSLEFSALWFIANYFVAACLEYTTVASSTILTSTSSVFTLLFGALFRVERFTLRKLLGVLASLTGIILISTIDLSGSNNDRSHRGDFPSKTHREIAVGDALAFLSAVMYGLYAVFMKKRIGDESRVDMPLFFGLVGLINVLLLWPGLVVLHYTGIEPFELPPTGRVTAIVLCNSAASLVSDLAWAYAVLLTSPIVVTVGLSMTIPLSLIGQVVINGQTSGWVYWVGAVVVLVSFLFVNQEEKREEEEEEQEQEEGEQVLEVGDVGVEEEGGLRVEDGTGAR